MEKHLEKWMEALPYPAAILCDEKNGVSRNRLARRLLPPATRLRGQLADLSDEFMRELKLDGIPYLVLSVPLGENTRLFCFFQNFLPLQEAFSRAVVEGMQDFFWTLLNRKEDPATENLIRLDQISARVCSLKRHGENYLRLINNGELAELGEAETCSLDGFFRHLQKALASCDISVFFRDGEGVNVYSESAVLSYLVLNLIQFAHLFEAEKHLFVAVKEEGDGIRFSMEISDRGEVKASLEDLILRGKERETVLFTQPLFCILRVCMEKGIPWTVSECGDKLSVSFVLAKGIEKPALFLSDATAAEVSELLQMIKGMFS